MTAFARIALPRAKVRLSAGSTRLSDETQTLCFYAGENSIFYGDKLLTADNPEAGKDRELLAKLGLDTLDPNPSLEVSFFARELAASPWCSTSSCCG
jgi:biotin synthase